MDFPLHSTISTEPSPTLGINERVQELWAQGETVYHLGFGESRFPVHPLLQDALAANAHRKGYLSVQGLPELRAAIANYYGRYLNRKFSPEQVIVAPGSKALLFALQMVLDADLILPTPSWVSYAPHAHLLGRPAYFIPASPEDGYTLSIDAIEETLSKTDKDTHLLILNSPNNPTGHMLSSGELAQLAEFCRANQIIILSDEIYSLVPHHRHSHASISTFYPEGTIILGGLSKHLSLGGWRLGKAILPDDSENLMAAVVGVASEIWSCASAPIQYAAVTAYSEHPDIEAYIAECKAIHSARSHYLWGWLNELGIRCPEPRGGFYLMPDFNQFAPALTRLGVHTSLDLSKHLLEEYHIATLPGSVFGIPEDQLSLRLSTSFIDMETDEDADQILREWRASSSAEAFLEHHHPNMDTTIDLFKQFVMKLRG